MSPPLLERITALRREKLELSEETLRLSDKLSELEAKVQKSQLQPQFAQTGRSLGRREFYNQKRSIQEILVALTDLLRNFHTVR